MQNTCDIADTRTLCMILAMMVLVSESSPCTRYGVNDRRRSLPVSCKLASADQLQ